MGEGVTLWSYLASHPWWGLVYLCILSGTATACATAISKGMRRSPTEDSDPPEKKIKSLLE
jgi:hypothetical protein